MPIPDLLRLIEKAGLTGAWSWRFATNEHVWSPGLFRLLGLEPYGVPPGYDLLVRLVHPEDRHRIATAAEILQGHILREGVVRVIRPDGTMRTLKLVTELRCAADGRPLSVDGTALDVTEQERLSRLMAEERRRREALYLTTYATTFSLGLDLLHRFPVEMAQVHGPSLDEISLDPFVMVVPEERAAFRDRAWEQNDRGLFFQGTAHERLANGEVWHFRIIGVPVWDEAGTYLGRSGLKYPVHAPGSATVDTSLRQGLEQAVRGHHLRAARALLDWSMTQLAEAGGLSLSTVRRLEEEAAHQSDRSRHRAVAALRRAGIRFLALDDGTIAVARA